MIRYKKVSHRNSEKYVLELYLNVVACSHELCIIMQQVRGGTIVFRSEVCGMLKK